MGMESHIIVVGNEKGGSGKSTAAMHIIVALLKSGYRVGTIDLDHRQQSLTRYLANRRACSEYSQMELTFPQIAVSPPSEADSRADAKAKETQTFRDALQCLSECHFIVIDCPGANTHMARLAHLHADTILTPMNDSFVDFDLLAQIDPQTRKVIRPSVYAEVVWEARKQRALSGAQKAVDWVVMRNRLSPTKARNQKEVGERLDDLADRIGFRTIEREGEDILLNGKPIFLRGISLHEEEIGVNPSRNMTPSNARALLTEIKNGLNGNFVRLAHYPHSDVMTRLADEMGLIVWSEIPVYWRIDWENTRTLSLAESMIQENILRDRNRASILFWSVGNETPISEKRNRFMTALVQKTRAIDSSRLITAALLIHKEMEDGVLTARIVDPLAEHLDVLSVNTYDGWYGPVEVADVSDIRWNINAGKPLIISEFGAGAFIGLSGEEVPRKFSLEYQNEMYRETLEMSEEISALRGISPWILKDFRSPRRQHSIYQNGWNRKGIITETGERKPAFHTLSDHYQKLETKWR